MVSASVSELVEPLRGRLVLASELTPGEVTAEEEEMGILMQSVRMGAAEEDELSAEWRRGMRPT